MVLWIIVIAVSVLIDQITKIVAAGNMALYESVPLIKGFFSFT